MSNTSFDFNLKILPAAIMCAGLVVLLFLHPNVYDAQATTTAYQFPNVLADGSLDTACADGAAQVTFTGYVVTQLIPSASASCSGDKPKRDRVNYTISSTAEQDLIMSYLDNGGYAADTVVTGQASGNDIYLKIKDTNGTGYIKLVEVNPANGAVISTVDTYSFPMTMNIKYLVTDLSGLFGTIPAGSTFGIKLSITPDDLTSTQVETKFGLYGTTEKQDLVNIDETEVVVPSGTGDPSDVGGGPATQVYFSGQAYPSSTVEVLRRSFIEDVYRNTPETTIVMNPDGSFSNTYVGLLSSDYVFTLRAYDVDGRTSGALSFVADLLFTDTLRVEDIFFPPTVGFRKSAALKGEDVYIVGYAAGGNTVLLDVAGVGVLETTAATSTGFYEVSLSTDNLAAGSYSVVARQISDTQESNYSTPRSFRVSTCCIRTDFNADNEVNITDWSIFLYRFQSQDKSLHASVDLNGDGKTDITDFSLFLQSITIPDIL
ncbi:MAG: hypothetical protein OQJ98_01815 [Candidatus Pacebacteria bacterium]|nr:hypothetical protein [Candidatus Paceibacterota bacterium]